MIQTFLSGRWWFFARQNVLILFIMISSLITGNRNFHRLAHPVTTFLSTRFYCLYAYSHPEYSWKPHLVINQYLFLPFRRGVLDTTLCQWLTTGRWFSPGIPVSSTNKADRHNIAEILLKMALNTITLTLLTSL